MARLCCQLSDSEAGAPVLWLKEGVELHMSPKYEMQRQGATCELLIHGLEAKDMGEYSCMVGSQKTLAFLKVKGERPLPHPLPLKLPRGHPSSLSSPSHQLLFRGASQAFGVPAFCAHLCTALCWCPYRRVSPEGIVAPTHCPASHPHPPPAGGAARPGPLSLHSCLS